MTNKVIFILLFLSFIGFTDAQTINGSFNYDGQTRTYSYYVPTSYITGIAVPLIVNLHGLGSSGSQQAAYTNFMSIADTANFIVVHPDGTYNPSNPTQRFWNFGGMGSNVDDLGFLEVLIDTLSAHYTINQNRVYSTGLSNGGYMSYYLACESNRFAAIASVGATMTTTMYNSCNPLYPIPVMEIHGTSDAIVAYNGSLGNKTVEEVIDLWVNKNNCNSTPTITQVPNTNTTDEATAEHYLYPDGDNGHTVELYKVIDGGHTWPGGAIPIPTFGNTCMDFSASKEIWRFFSQYSNPYVGINAEKIENNHLSIYPNPTNGKLNIKLENNSSLPYELTIYDMQGREIVSQQSNQLSLLLNLEHLQPGIYNVNVRNSKMNITSSIVLNN